MSRSKEGRGRRNRGHARNGRRRSAQRGDVSAATRVGAIVEVIDEAIELVEENAREEAVDLLEDLKIAVARNLADVGRTADGREGAVSSRVEADRHRDATRAREAPGSPWPGWTAASDVATALGVCTATVRRWASRIQAKEGPIHTAVGASLTVVRRSAGGRWLFSTDEVRIAARLAQQEHGGE